MTSAKYDPPPPTRCYIIYLINCLTIYLFISTEHPLKDTNSVNQSRTRLGSKGCPYGLPSLTLGLFTATRWDSKGITLDGLKTGQTGAVLGQNHEFYRIVGCSEVIFLALAKINPPYILL